MVSDDYEIIYADPPWHYYDTQTGAGSGSGAMSHYDTLELPQLVRLGVEIQPFIADDCLLFCWTTGPNLHWAVDMVRGWQFDYKTVAFVWDKERQNAGHYTVSQCEFVLVGKRGRIPKPRGRRSVKQMLRGHYGGHSTKPNKVAKRIENMFPSQNKLELFAREERPGWTVWGNEVGDPLGIGFDPKVWGADPTTEGGGRDASE